MIFPYSRATASLITIGAAMMLAGCESSGSLRVAGVGATPVGTTGPAGPEGPQGAQGPQGDTGATGDTGASGGVGLAGAGALAVGGLVGPEGVAGTGLLANTGNLDATNPVVSTLLVTAGNAVETVGGVQAHLAQVVDSVLPGVTPVTATVAQVLNNTGQALIRTGNGEAYLVDGLTAAPGELVTVAIGNVAAIGGVAGQDPLIGASLLAAHQQDGQLLTVGVGSAGQLLTLQPGPITGGTGNALGGLTSAVGGLAQVSASGATLVGGNGQTPLVDVAVLSPDAPSGALLGVGVASGGAALSVTPGTGADGGLGGVLGSTTGVVQQTVANVTGSLGGGGATPTAPVTGLVSNVVGTVTGTLNGVGASGSASGGLGSSLATLTGGLGGTLGAGHN